MKLRSWMMLGVGYVLGSKAGQEHYQELRRKMSELASSPQVSDALAKARENLGMAQPQSLSATSEDGGGEVDVTDSADDDQRTDSSQQPQNAESLP